MTTETDTIMECKCCRLFMSSLKLTFKTVGAYNVANLDVCFLNDFFCSNQAEMFVQATSQDCSLSTKCQ